MIEGYASRVEAALKIIPATADLPELYEPIRYTLAFGGKRLRPVLTLLAADLFEGSNEASLQAAIGIELFHNFTLIHDDVMDNAPLRRGNPTVFKKWNLNTAILSGDVLYAIACQHISRSAAAAGQEIMDCFLQTSVEVCEGQQWDMNFEQLPSIKLDEYMHMIEYKTARLLACALKLGALTGKANMQEANQLFEYGNKIGIAFQLLDDYLDTFGDADKFGKQKGGDILAGKKTFLYLHTMAHGNEKQVVLMKEQYGKLSSDDVTGMQKIVMAFRESGADVALKSEVEKRMTESENLLNNLTLAEQTKQELIHLSRQLTTREI